MALRKVSSITTALKNPILRRRNWWLIDAKGQRVGRLATQIASVLMGKHKPIIAPNVDVGDYVVVINSDKVEFTGTKWDNKYYRWHTTYPGGLKSHKAKDYHKLFPDRILQFAVSGMLPKNRTRKFREKRLQIYAGNEHPHKNVVPYRLERTINKDLHMNWDANLPVWTVEFYKEKVGTPEEHYVMETTEPVIDAAEKKRIKELKRAGMLGKGKRRVPHPELIRGGFPEQGKRF